MWPTTRTPNYRHHHHPDSTRHAAQGLYRLPAAVALLVLAAGPPVLGQEEGWIEFAEGEVRPSFAISVNDEQGKALLQPGLAVNAVSAEFAERAGIRRASSQISITGVYGENEMPEARAFDLGFAGTEMRAEGFAILPGEMAEAEVMFGRPLFQGAVLQLDYPNRRLRILPPEGVKFEGNVEFRMSQHNRPLVRTQIQDKKMWMLLDTSSKGLCLLKSRVVDDRNWGEQTVDPSVVQALDVELGEGMQPLKLDELELGPYAFEGFIAAYSPTGDHRIDAREKIYGKLQRMDLFEADGVLGYEILRNFVITLNVTDGKAHFYAP